MSVSTHTFNSTLGRQRKVEFCEFGASLVYRVCCRLLRDMVRSYLKNTGKKTPPPKKKQKAKKQNKTKQKPNQNKPKM